MHSDCDGTRVVPPSSTNAPSSSPAEPPAPANAFADTFLTRLDDREEPPTAAEADLAGPWRIERLPDALGGGFGLFRLGESIERGDLPFARFDSLWLARLVAALILTLGGDPVEFHDPAIVNALQVADGLMRSPEALALFLEACGKVALERAGAILACRV
jgi:hypothetical protein